MDYKIVYDTTPAVEASIESIVHTFVEALILVTLVVFIFLQNIRATIIPLITIPVSLIGTFIFFPMLGFSVNTLSMFGLVLAIGIVVDDAIVVVEAVIHHLEHGLEPKEATIKAMEEVTAPVIGIALILSAVFVPVAMLGGLVGSMYKQFALTIAISVLLSAFNALSLTPALCAMMLKQPKPMRGPLGTFFKGFNKAFDVSTKGYVNVSRVLVRRSLLTIGIVVAVAIGASLFARVLPAGFIPDEDQGIFGVNVQLPAGASLERTSLVLKKIEDILAKTDGLDSYQTIGGYGAVTNTFQPNYGTIFVRMKPWDERKTKALHVNGIMGGLRPQFAAIPEAVIFPFNIPTLSGFGAASGFNYFLQDRSGSLTIEQLGEQSQKFITAARQRPELGTVFTSFDPNYPQVRVDLDREKARTLGVPVNEVFQALSTTLGGSYVNDFNRFGRLYRVYVQSDATQRLKADDIGKIYVRSKTTNEMVPLSTLVTIRDVTGAELTTRFNLLRSVEIQGSARARLHLRTGARRARAGVRRDDALGDGLRLLVDVLPGEDRPARRADVHHGDRLRVPAAGGAVRKLAAALGGTARVSAGGARRLLRRLADGLRQQRVRADRPRDADRPRGEERDPDRRVCQGEARRRRVARGSGDGISAPAFPSDPDDGLRLHPRCRAADARHRRGRRGTERDGHRCLLGHAGRHRAGRVHHSGQLHIRRRTGPRRQEDSPRRRSLRKSKEPSE